MSERVPSLSSCPAPCPSQAPGSPHLAGADVAGLREPIVLHEELAGGQRLRGTQHGLWEQLLDLFDGPHVEGALFGRHAPLRGRIRILCAVEASRLWGGESCWPQPSAQWRPRALPQPGPPASVDTHPVTQVPSHVLQDAFGNVGIELITRDLRGGRRLSTEVPGQPRHSGAGNTLPGE